MPKLTEERIPNPKVRVASRRKVGATTRLHTYTATSVPRAETRANKKPRAETRGFGKGFKPPSSFAPRNGLTVFPLLRKAQRRNARPVSFRKFYQARRALW